MSTENLTLRVPLRWTSVEIFLVVSCFRNRESVGLMGPLAPIEIFLYVVNQIDSMLSYVCSEVGSITSRCSGKEPAFPSQGVTQTRNERAAEIEPSSEVDYRRLKNVLRTLVKHSVTASRVTLFLLLFWRRLWSCMRSSRVSKADKPSSVCL